MEIQAHVGDGEVNGIGSVGENADVWRRERHKAHMTLPGAESCWTEHRPGRRLMLLGWKLRSSSGSSSPAHLT
jgi:hypothetical protein